MFIVHVNVPFVQTGAANWTGWRGGPLAKINLSAGSERFR